MKEVPELKDEQSDKAVSSSILGGVAIWENVEIVLKKHHDDEVSDSEATCKDEREFWSTKHWVH